MKQLNYIYRNSLENFIFFLLFVILAALLLFPTIMKLSGYNSNILPIGIFDIRRLIMTIPLLIIPITCLYSQKARDYFMLPLLNLKPIYQICFAVFVLATLISSLISTAPLQAMLVGFEQILLLFMMFFIAGMSKNFRSTKKILLYGLIISCFIYIAFSVGVMAYVNTLNFKFSDAQLKNIYIYMDFTNPRFFGQYLTWIIPFLSLPLLFNYHRLLKVIIFIALCYFWYLLIVCDSRALMVEWFLYFLLLPLIFRKDAFVFLLINLIACIFVAVFATLMFSDVNAFSLSIRSGSLIFIVAYAIILISYFMLSLFNRKHLSSDRSRHSVPILIASLVAVILVILLIYFNFARVETLFSSNGRFIIWKASIEPFFNHLGFGVGPGLLPLYGLKVTPIGSAVVVAQPHNFVVRIIAEMGILGFLSLFIPILAGIFIVIKKSVSSHKQNMYDPAKLVLVAILIGAIMHSLVSGLLEVHISQFVGAIVIGVLISEYLDFSLCKNYSKPVYMVIITVIITMVMYVSWATAYSVKNISEIKSAYVCRQTPSPFYWTFGSSTLDYPGQYFCIRNLNELKHWSRHGPFNVRIVDKL